MQWLMLAYSPSSVSCHTMPSRLTLVPGSQGPRQSGSVARDASDVLDATERVRTIICSHGDAMLSPTAARRWRAGGAGVETGDSICKREGGRHETHHLKSSVYSSRYCVGGDATERKCVSTHGRHRGMPVRP
jgi:hypothetical protein